jgi:isoleucyl-tRNA synthetase
MTDYKNTLNLPKTEFPMKANLSQREPEILAKWEKLNLYTKLRQEGKKRKKFIFHDGPPYANGHIHMGTAVNKILKDIVTKSKTISGWDAPFVPGWDCHGLPIELNVEKKIGKVGQKVDVIEFIRACREYAMNFINIQRDEFKRLGVQADWENPYLTMDPSFEANIIRSLAKIFKNGHVIKGIKPVHWCLDCCSALAEAEVEYKEKTSPQIDVRFRVLPDDEKTFLVCFKELKNGHGPVSVPIWTTTPWTLPANEAVSLNALISYVLVQAKEERLLVAEDLLPQIMERYGIADYEVLGKTLGESLENIKLQHPFYNRIVPIVLGEHVTVESGTGAVHTAPAHGQDDFMMAKKYNLPIYNPVGDDGCFISTTEIFAGQHVNKVNDRIIEILKEKNALLSLGKMTHSYPHCWRHKTPLIFRATPQWFISMEQKGLRKAALEAISRVTWIPDWGQNRIHSMIENRPDWCISRQRTWGTPMALFIHKETGDPHPNTVELMEKVAQLIEKSGMEAWVQLDEKEFLGEEDAKHYKKSRDTLDVWFDSGVTHECVLKKNPELHFPADLYLEGSDQHRGWFHSSLLTSVAINGVEPYKTIVTHNYVIDVQGQKMSKSLGNVIAPETIIQKFGADVLRLWVSSVDYRTDINVSEEIIMRTSETYRRLRNTARFLLANLEGFDPEKHLVAANKMLSLDRWVVDYARRVQTEIIEAYNDFQFHIIYQKIYHFCSIVLGSFYLDIIKDRQYTTQTNSLARRSAQTAMYHIIEALVRWLAPILSFTAEEIWQFIPGKRSESVFLNTWYTELASLNEKEIMNEKFWDKIQKIRDAVNKEIETQRNAGKIGSALEADVLLYCDTEVKSQLDTLENELRFVLITSSAKTDLVNSHTPDGSPTEVPGLWVKVTPIVDQKCERCWHRRKDVGSDLSHPTLCARCIDNVDGKGEVRKYA